MAENKTIYRVSEINRYLKNKIQGDPGLQNIWVSGELSNFKHHRSGHMYFTVKDGASSLRSVFFRRENARCPFQPADGMEVLLYGNISVYEPDGVYQLYVSLLEPAGTGSLYLAFEQLKEKLAAEGLFREDRKKIVPQLPRRIGLITSPSGAALQDIIATVEKRFPHVELLVVESLVQGAGAATDLVRAIKLLNHRTDIDLVILARGGGSLEDLWPFNEESVARAIYSSRLPVISAVGHETDFTIADFVSDLRAATPTAAAQLATPELEEIEARLDHFERNAALALQRRLSQEKQYLDQLVSERFFRLPVSRAQALRDKLVSLEGDLRRESVRNLQDKGNRLKNLVDKLESYSPLNVMSRGYSYCRDEQGNIIRTIRDVKPGGLLNLNFRDGRAQCRAEKVEEDAAVEG